MDKFSALSDPTRRSIIEMLAQRGQLSASEIGEAFPVSPPAISQHLKILREAGLVSVEKQAQKRVYRLNPEAISELEGWARHLEEQWNRRFDALDRMLAAEKKKATQNENERTAKMIKQSQKELNLTRFFDAPRELVYKAWTDPSLFAMWFSPDVFTIPVCELDVRPGGAILVHMVGPDGVIYPMTGVFHEVVPPERLVYLSRAVMDEAGNPQLETLTTVTLDDENGKTKMTVHITVTKVSPAAEFALNGMAEGWNQNLKKLADLLSRVRKENQNG